MLRKSASRPLRQLFRSSNTHHHEHQSSHGAGGNLICRSRLNPTGGYVVPSKVNRFVDVSSVIRGQNAAIRKLQSFPANGATLLVSVENTISLSGLAYYGLAGNNFEYLAGAGCPQASFTLARPTPILVIAEMGGWFGSGGTANYALVRASILAHSTDLQGALDVNGVKMESGYQYNTVGAGVSNASAVICATVPAGTWWASWGYAMQGGAVTTFGVTSDGIDVFQLAG